MKNGHVKLVLPVSNGDRLATGAIALKNAEVGCNSNFGPASEELLVLIQNVLRMNRHYQRHATHNLAHSTRNGFTGNAASLAEVEYNKAQESAKLSVLLEPCVSDHLRQQEPVKHNSALDGEVTLHGHHVR